VNPKWSKGYARKGAALHGARRWDEAIAAYEEGIKLEDSPALRKGLKEVQDAKEGDSPNLGNMFADPMLFGKLAANPKTAPLLADQDFVEKLRTLQRSPNSMELAFKDPRMIQVMGVLMGIDLQAFERPEGSTELPPDLKPMDSPPFSPKYTAPVPESSTTQDAHMSEVESDEEEDEDAKADAKAKAEAEAEKKKGNEAYKKRDFATAEKAFEKAWELWPKDITFLSNLGAVYFEKGDYDKTIEVCEKAVEEGRSIRADYKLVAKALGRIGNAYSKKGDWDNAVKYYSKSLTEHRTPDILDKLRDAEKRKAEAEKQSYINPELSHKAREEGNALFKAGDFAGAVKSYTESIKRDPSDARGYNNRAAAYTKLVALPEALKDVEEAIKVDPKFVKAYIRKSSVLLAMREYSKAFAAAQAATDVDVEKKHTQEIQAQIFNCEQAMYNQRAGETEEETLQRAMRDPEVAAIMNDPVIQQILQQAQQNPAALQDHMKNAVVRVKIEKLIAAGIIRTR